LPVTAAYLVRRTRELVAIIEGTNQTYRDGFISDDAGSPDPDKIPILNSVQDFYNLCSIAGAKPRYVFVPPVIGTRDYITPDDVASIMGVYFNGRPLYETTREALDRSDPLWLTFNGDPTRYFVEGDQIVLDKMPVGGVMVWRCGMSLDQLDPTDPLSMSDSALAFTQIIRVPFGAAVMLINIDALNRSHQARIDEYRRIANGLLAEISGSTHNRDTTKHVSLDTWMPDMQYPGTIPIYGTDDSERQAQGTSLQ
jgi:hypothetical protein